MMAERGEGSARGGPPPEGVPLDRYAAVLAMRGEGIPLDEALARAGVDARAWAAAERAWEVRIARADEALLGELDEALAAAQDRLARPVPPIDRELAAWLDFIRHWMASASPVARLESLGLRVEDVFRLQRAWGRRLKEDAALRQSAGRIMQRPPGPMPAIWPEPLALGPWPAPAPGPSAAAGAGEAAALPPLCTPLPGFDGVEAPLPPAPPPPAPSIVPEGMRHFTSLGGTHLAPPVAPKGPALPFQPEALGGARAAVERAIAHGDAVQGPRPATGGGPVGATTADVSAALRALPATPFEGGAAPPKPAAADAVVPEGMRGFLGITETQDAVGGARRPATPFEAIAPPAPLTAPPLSLEQYASLCVEAALHPARLPEILRRYHLTAEQRPALDAHWQGRIAGDPAVRAAWERACATYRQWLLEQRGRAP